MSLLMANRALIKPLSNSIPTVDVFGDSNCEGRGTSPNPSISRYISQYATNIIYSDKVTIKIFDHIGGSNEFVTLNPANAQISNTINKYGVEQSLGYALAQYYGVQEVRIRKYGISSGFAGIYSAYPSFTPGQSGMTTLEGIFDDSLVAAAAEGITLDVIGAISFLGTNDATVLATANAYEVNMTAIINHLRTNVYDKNVPFILTSATDAVTYQSTVNTAMQNICATLDDCYYLPVHGYNPSQSHLGDVGYYVGGIDIANSIITNILGDTSIVDDYNFKYTTKASGTYTLSVSHARGMIGYYIDWGDGTNTEITSNYTAITHTYADASEKTLKINTLAPWNISSLLLNNTAITGIVGEFDISQLTGLDDFRTSASTSAFTSIVYPVANYAHLVNIAYSLFDTTGLTSIDFSRFTGTVYINNNVNLTSVLDNSIDKTKSGLMYINNNDALILCNISGIKYITGQGLYFTGHAIIPSYTHIGTKPTAMVSFVSMNSNLLLEIINNYQNFIYANNFDIRNNKITLAQMDNIVNEMYARMDTAFYKNQAGKIVSISGNNGITGTFDGTTDWSGGLPTSPAAKAYDLLNDVTGTYNFSTFQIV